MASIGRRRTNSQIISRRGVFASQAAYDAIYGKKYVVIDAPVVTPTENPVVWSKDDVIPTTIGGIASGTVGQTLDGLSAIEILEKLLYPYQTLSFSSFTTGLPISQTVEVGTPSASVEGPHTSTWALNNSSNLTANSISISRSQNSSGLTPLVSSLSGTSSSVTHPVYSYSAPTNLIFTISANQTTGGAVTKTQTYSWRKKIWYGKSNSTALTQYSDFSSFSSIFTHNLTSISSANYSFPTTTGDDQYLYIIIPADSSYSTFTDAGFESPFEPPVTITITNSKNVQLDYKYYRSFNPQILNITVAAGV